MVLRPASALAVLVAACVLLSSCSTARLWIRSDYGFNRSIEVLEFHADWCLPCRKMEPVIDLLEKDYPHVTFTRIDFDRDPRAGSYDVSMLPTVLVLSDGRVVARSTGIKSYWELARIIEYDR
jgi:thioredoxin 1